MLSLGVVLGLVATACFLFVWSWRTWKFRETIDRIPGPPALPWIGNAHIFKTNAHEFYVQILEFCEEYGSREGIFRCWAGPQGIAVVTKGSTVEVLLNSTKHITKAQTYEALYPWLGTGLLTSTGDKWKRRRRQLTPTFHFRILNDFQQIFNEQAAIMVTRLEEQCGNKGQFNIFPYITLCALDIICETAMGKSINAQATSDSEYVKAVYEIGEVIQERMKKPWWRPDIIFNNTHSGRIHKKCLKILHGFTNKVILERSAALDAQMTSNTSKITMEDLQSGTPFTIGKQKRLAFLDMLLVASKAGAELTHRDIQEEVDTFMFEGHDTTAAAANWAVYLLGCHPDVQQKAQEELDEIFGDDRTRPADPDDIKKMRYLEYVIKETLRLYPSVPMFAREIEEDCVIAGYHIPKGSSSVVVTSALHRDPDAFPDPERYDPDRWLPDNAAGRHPYSYIPFSAGMRNCIGQKFAMNEEKVLLSAILRNYTIKSHQTREQLKPVGELILRPENGIIVSIEKRPL